ncbi:hypothetical protein [Aureimonas sp. N4]|uniref:hypothetical protein n=1 Tax=Aureimonas sp. N4 TaxID=1638165 RepID=UPI00078092BA|nr:hypothetical protein [Aureimonas sp. N4]
MNPRILKKLSALAAPLLPLLGDTREQFRAVKGENYHSVFILDRRHWERSGCHPSYMADAGRIVWRAGSIAYTTRAGHRVAMLPPSQPLKGTMMVGSVAGYYEPEWDEETAWEALCALVYAFFTDFGPNGEDWLMTRIFRGPGDILRAARWIAAQSEDVFE